MPCRSDYMEPTERERNRGNKIVTGLNKLADELTYANDVLREFLLGETTEAPLLYINLHDRIQGELDTLVAQESSLYNLAVPQTVPGLMRHVKGLLRDYKRLNVMVVNDRTPSKASMLWVESEQVKHREADLSRLMKVFAANGDRQRLRKVLDADNTKPLEPQLGFSPDDF